MACHNPRPFTRREALSKVGGGFGLLAFANLVQSSLKAGRDFRGDSGDAEAASL